MKFIKTKILDLIIIEPSVFGDNRGYFLESFNKKKFEDALGNISFVQDNESKSSKGVLRGLHFQKPPFEQAKLVRCVEGEVLDVVVDIRKNSKTYGKHLSILLSGENKRQLFVPRGFAHGFLVLSDSAIFSYKVDNYYAPEFDAGIRWNDKDLNVQWRVEDKIVKISEKDAELPFFSELVSPFEIKI
jgi:dTDP-4-dehydrorhamnose 3,5-epimerase